MKRYLSFILTAAMVLSLLPFCFSYAFADELVDSQGLIYHTESNGESCFVYGCDTDATEIVIPSEYNGLPVTRIGDWAFEGCSKLESITIGDAVTRLGIESFYNCTSLTRVEFPQSVTKVSGWAFSGCTSLSEVVFSNPCVTVGYQAFLDCDGLTYTTYDNAKYLGSSSNPYMVLVECVSEDITSCTVHEDTFSIAGGSFENCSTMEKITLSDNIKVVGESAFQNCSALTEILLPDGVTALENSCFYNCSSLKTPIIPKTVTRIDFCAFYGCDLFTDIILPEAVTFTGSSIFSSCDNLVAIFCEADARSDDWNKSWTSGCTATVYWGCSEGCAFDSDGSDGYAVIDFADCVTEAVIPSTHDGANVTAIDEAAFSSCALLGELVIPATVENISANTFSDCSDLSIIYCEATAKPDGWDDAWLGECGAIVVWGYDAAAILADLIAEADSLDSDDYYASDWQKLQSELETAKALDTATATLKETKDAADSLSAVLSSLEKIPDVLGDLDGNGIFDGADVLLGRQYDANALAFDDSLLSVADVNHDGIFDGSDVLWMVQMDADAVTDWPA